jgi:hypothetical protein
MNQKVLAGSGSLAYQFILKLMFIPWCPVENGTNRTEQWKNDEQ